LEQAKRLEAIVTSVFPKEVGLRLIAQSNDEAWQPGATRKSLHSFLAKNGESSGELSEQRRRKPIADLFPNTTVMFADMVGFTAWSSTREPSQVFILLETVYNEFDNLAKQRKVFKVETVGDCYVAVCGLVR
jgi:class 3 adenylate cyclase